MRNPIDTPMFGLRVHPGEILVEEFMKPYGLSASQLALALKTAPANVSRIINGKQAVSPEMASRLACAFGTTVGFWMNLQNNYDLASIGKARWDEIRSEVSAVRAA
ncbi:HigA family addiction module antitoxin [Maricaulis sp.]|uniref:HigA family addiction module antitoxin n=1 Tax=Maricaulis sp. TaxID=1486257 RepID=UPI003A8EA422